jgi:hypothetical protein
MASNRVYYAVQRATLTRCNSNGLTSISGADAETTTYPAMASSMIQSVGVSTSLDYEQIFELGRLQIFQNVEGIPSVEITVERALAINHKVGSIDATYADGTMWHLAGNSTTAAAAQRFNLDMQTAADEGTLSAEGFVRCTGLYMSNYTLNFNLEGASTESATFVGNDIRWSTGDISPVAGLTSSAEIEAYTDSPDTNSGVLDRRTFTGGTLSISKLQSATFSVSMDREDLLQLGSKTPFFRAASFPVETTLEVEYLANKDSNGITINENLLNSGCDVGAGLSAGDHLKAGNRTFKFGSMNWTGSSYSGGDAGGGNATISFNYQGFNFLNITTNTDFDPDCG